MKERMSALAIGAGVLAAPAAAQTITQNIDYLWDYQGKENIFTFAQFDDMGGTRALTGVRFVVDSTYSFSFYIDNGDPNPIPAFAYDPSPTISANLSPLNASLFLGPIASDTQKLESVDLAADDGVFGSGPDQAFFSVDGALAGTAEIDTSSFAEFTGNGFLLFEYGSFPIVNLPKGFFAGVIFDQHTHSGVLSLEYDYVLVPAAPTASVIVLGTLATLRRRRR